VEQAGTITKRHFVIEGLNGCLSLTFDGSGATGTIEELQPILSDVFISILSMQCPEARGRIRKAIKSGWCVFREVRSRQERPDMGRLLDARDFFQRTPRLVPVVA